MSPDDPRHGTYAGASEHRKRGVALCGPCLRAERHRHILTMADRIAGRPRTLPALGTVRRIHALQAIGWTIADIARQSDLYEKTLRNPVYRGTSVYRATAEAIAATYDRLGDTAPVGPYHDRCRNMAARRGYPPPSAWFGVDIDDPGATPDPGWSEPKRTDLSVLAEDFDWLVSQGESEHAAAARLGIKRLDHFKDSRRRMERTAS